MGWWSPPGTDDVIGDEPLDALGTAMNRVVASYTTALGRLPTKREWEVLLGTVLGAASDELDDRPFGDAGTISAVRIELRHTATPDETPERTR